jgi:5'-methylthioadenosine phosphorylase
MTQYPEVILARELEVCYLNVSLITDWDVGLEGNPEVKPVTVEEVIRVFNENNERLKELIDRLVPRIPAERTCACATALSGAVIG